MLDTIATFFTRYSPLLFLVSFLLFSIVVLSEKKRSSGNNKKDHFFSKTSALLLAFSIFSFIFPTTINPLFLGWGYNIMKLDSYLQSGDILWYQDHINISGGEILEPDYHYRFHGLKLKTGEKISTIDKNMVAALDQMRIKQDPLYTTESGDFSLTSDTRKFLSNANGEILITTTQPQRVITLSYTTINQSHFLIKAFDFSGAKKWEITSDELQTNWLTDDFFLSYHPFSGFVMYDKNFIGLGAGYAFAIDLETGKIAWKRRL